MRWCDPEPPTADCISWIEEFGLGIISGIKEGENAGCACRSLETIRKWFRPNELERLRLFGFRVYRIDADRILAESENQVVFVRRRPLNLGVVEVHA